MTTAAHAAETAVLGVSGVQWASEKAVIETVLGRRPGVVAVEANPVAQTAAVVPDLGRRTVRLDPRLRLPLPRPVGAPPHL